MQVGDLVMVRGDDRELALANLCIEHGYIWRVEWLATTHPNRTPHGGAYIQSIATGKIIYMPVQYLEPLQAEGVEQ